MTVLVTGGTGYIGAHTCVELLSAGYEVVVADNFVNSKPEVIGRIKEITGKDFKFYETDVTDKQSLDKIFSENKIDAVIHFAGLKAVGESVEKPLEYYRNNLTSTLSLCEAMREHDCFNLVFSSSATVYSAENEVPYVEGMSTSCTNPYGWTKLMTEQILSDAAKADERLSVMLLRYFNPIGAHESGLIGEDPQGIPNNLLPYIGRVAAGRLEKLGVFGNDYPTPDGTGVRDYVHVVDLAKGHLAAIDYCVKHKGAERINLGTGKGTSVLEILHAFERACGKAIPYEIKPRRKGDIATCYANCDKARELLGFSARYTIDEMCESSWKFMCENY
jgi:UDP-glucose 4-epimerase